MINVTDVAIMTSYLTAWMNTHNVLARKMKDQNGVLKGAMEMETVEVVIRIPKQIYDYLMNLYKERGMTDFNGYAENAIVNGIVLPKNHGRLVDADAINIHDVSPTYGMEVYGVTQDDIEYEPTIIEADRAESEGKK